LILNERKVKMERKYKYHCADCKHLCPFVDVNGFGNCFIDMKIIEVDEDRCEKFELDNNKCDFYSHLERR
jgi:hypothetical protein